MLDARYAIKPALSPVSFLLLTKHKNHNAYKIAARLASGKCLLAVPLHDTPMSSKLLLLFSSVMLVLVVEL